MDELSKSQNPIIVTIDCSEEVRNEARLNDILMLALHNTAYNYVDFIDRVLGAWWMKPTTDESEIEQARWAGAAGMNREIGNQFQGQADWRDHVKLVLLGPDIDVRLQYVRDLFASLFPNAFFMGVDREVISTKTLWGEGFRYGDLSPEEGFSYNLLEELGLGSRPYIALKQACVETIGEVADRSRKELREILNFNPRDVEEVIRALKKHGLRLRMDVEVDEKLRDVPIDELDFSLRTHNLLLRTEILTIGDLLQWSEKEISGIDQAGKKTVDEIVQQLAHHELKLAPDA